MALQVGDLVRVTRGDMRGYVGIIRRPLRISLKGGRTYGVEFPGETSLSNFRASNIEAAKEQDVLPEFLEINNVILRLIGDEPYELITGGLMGKRRRYWLTMENGSPRITIAHKGAKECDVRRFPVERDGSVVTGLWSRFQPHPEHIAYVLSFVSVAHDP